MGTSIFEIIGPVMIGPSSSHTAGMARIGRMAHGILGEEPVAVHLTLSPLLQNTYRGHHTDDALFGGVYGFGEDDPRLRSAGDWMRGQGIRTSVDFLPADAPQNSVLITAEGRSGSKVRVFGTSVGGGSVVLRAVDGVSMELLPEPYQVLLWSSAPLPELAHAEGVQGGWDQDTYVSCLTAAQAPEEADLSALRENPTVQRLIVLEPVLSYGVSRPEEWAIDSCKAIAREAKERGITVGELAVLYEARRSGFPESVLRERMRKQLHQMQESVKQGMQKGTLQLLPGGAAARMLSYIGSGTISGGIVPLAAARAIGVMEYNGAMGCIVAAPTAGSSGIVPGCFLTVQEQYGISENRIVDALFVCGLLGVVMAHKGVSFSGSVGGCQGEIGVSSAISAAGLCSLFTDDPEAILHAMALCLKNLLGLVCDPIAGPIEVPCIKRNALGVSNAFLSADLSLAGIRSFIPPDEVIDALIDVEQRLPQELKCATVGGLASTCTARCVRAKKQ